MIRQASVAAVLIALSLLIQSAGMAALIHWGRMRFARGMYGLGPVRSAVLMVRFTSVIIVLHLLQVLVWAAFYRWYCFPSWESALYFSTASYSTIGSGDLLLSPMWRTMGALESVTGVLMCGLSASFLFAIVTRLIEREARFSPHLVKPAGKPAPTPAQSSASRRNEKTR